jgi:hypothetical protein
VHSVERMVEQMAHELSVKPKALGHLRLHYWHLWTALKEAEVDPFCSRVSAHQARPQAAPYTAWSSTGSKTFGVCRLQGGGRTPVSGSQLDYPTPQAKTPNAEPTATSWVAPLLSSPGVGGYRPCRS